MIKAERIQRVKLTDGGATYRIAFKSGGEYDIPKRGVGLPAFLDNVRERLSEIKAYLIVDTESYQILAACMRIKSSWTNFAFVKELDEDQARGLMECLERLQGRKETEGEDEREGS
jgi:hypothetical protein